MWPHWTVMFITWTLVLRTSSQEDLLDQYDRYVENSLFNQRHLSDNNINSDKNQRQRFQSNDRQRDRRETNDDSQWTHSEQLDEKGDIVLRWQPRHQEILFKVEAKTLGYIGIGFSPNGGMEGADIVLGWIDDKTATAYLRDCHGGTKTQGSAPIRDEIDNYRLIYGSQNDTHTVLEFRRALDTCDPDDYILGSDTVRVIWAIHDKDPQHGAEMVYHGENRGAQSLHFLGPPPVPKPERDVRIWDVTLKNFDIKEDTIYWCKVFRSPPIEQKHHVVGYEPLIGKNHSNFVHHMLLHECEINAKDINKWEQFTKGDGVPCYGSEMPKEWEKCLTPMVAWAIGSKGENFPKHVGIPLEAKTSNFFMLEVHFDNPSIKRAEDTSGLRLFYTQKLRKNEASFLVAGVTISPLHFIPPQQSEYKSGGYCSVDCTKEVLPKDGIHVVSVLLHSHLAGRKLKLRHVRGDKELAPIAEDNRYDFNYQQSRRLSHEVTILPGDGLVTECTYSTLKRKKPTLGGYSTREEMCLAFVLHYPRTTLAGCYSMPPIKYFFDILGVKEFYDHSTTDVENIFLHGVPESTVPQLTPPPSLFPPYRPGDENSAEANLKAIQALQNAKEFTEVDVDAGLIPFDRLVIKEPLEFRNKTFTSHLQSLPYNETLLTRRIEEYFYTGLHLTFCRKRDDTLALPEKIEKFPNFTVYSDNSTKIQCSYRQKVASAMSRSCRIRFSSVIILGYIFRLVST